MVKEFLILLFVIITFIGCGGGESNENSSIPKGTVATISGKVIDGEIVGATIFLDLNRNSSYDKESEPIATTDKRGNYKLYLKKEHIENPNYKNKTAQLIAFGGYDLDTKELFKGEFRATIDSNLTNITPTTSMIAYSVIDKNKNIEEEIRKAKEKISKSINVNAQLLKDDPIQLAIKGEKTLLNASYQIVKFQDFLCKEAFSKDKEIMSCYQLIYKEIAKQIKDKNIDSVENLISNVSKSVKLNIKDEVRDASKKFVKNIEEKIKSSNFYNSEKIAKISYEIKEIGNKFKNELKKAKPSIDDSWNNIYQTIKLSDDYIKKENIKNLLILGGHKVNDAIVNTISALKEIKLDISLEEFNKILEKLNRLDNFVDDIHFKKDEKR